MGGGEGKGDEIKFLVERQLFMARLPGRPVTGKSAIWILPGYFTSSAEDKPELRTITDTTTT